MMNINSNLVLKVQYKDDIRIIPIHNEDITFDELILMMQRIFKSNFDMQDDLIVKYKDSDGDFITILDDSDLSFAIKNTNILQIRITNKCVDSENVPSHVMDSLCDIRDKVIAIISSLSTKNEIKQHKHSEKVLVSNVLSNSNHLVNKEFDPLISSNESKVSKFSDENVATLGDTSKPLPVKNESSRSTPVTNNDTSTSVTHLDASAPAVFPPPTTSEFEMGNTKEQHAFLPNSQGNNLNSAENKDFKNSFMPPVSYFQHQLPTDHSFNQMKLDSGSIPVSISNNALHTGNQQMQQFNQQMQQHQQTQMQQQQQQHQQAQMQQQHQHQQYMQNFSNFRPTSPSVNANANVNTQPGPPPPPSSQLSMGPPSISGGIRPPPPINPQYFQMGMQPGIVPPNTQSQFNQGAAQARFAPPPLRPNPILGAPPPRPQF